MIKCISSISRFL